MTGLSGVLSYLYQGKFKILLSAEGKNYVTTAIVTGMNICINVSKAVLLVLGFDVVAVQISYFLFNVVQTLIYSVYIKRHYPWLDLKVEPNYDAISQKNAVLVHQISSLIFSNTDVLVLSVFASLKEVSVYSLYVLIYGLVSSIGETVYESYRYAIGQSYHSDQGRFTHLFNTYEVFVFVFSFALFTVTRTLINPFLTLYTAGVYDITYTDKYLPWLFAAYYIMNNGRTSSNMVINIAERFEDTKWRSAFESVINVVVSLLAVQWLGIYGVLIGTIAALLYRTNDMIIYASHILERTPLVTYKRWIVNIIGFVVISLIFSRFTFDAGDYFQLAGYGVILTVSSFAFYLILNYLTDRQYVTYGITTACRTLKNALHSFKSRAGAH